MASHDQHPLPAGPGPSALALRREAALSELMATQVEAGARTDDRIDLKTIWRALVRRKRTILGVTALCTLAAGVYTLQMTPQYKSSALLQIDRAAQKVVGFNAEVEVDEGPLADQLQLRTQIELMKSRSLAERVIDEMGLYQSAPSAAASTVAPLRRPTETQAAARSPAGPPPSSPTTRARPSV